MKLLLCYFLFVVEHVTDHNTTILWRERIELKNGVIKERKIMHSFIREVRGFF